LIVEIVAGVAIVVAVGFIWHGISGTLFPPASPVTASPIRTKQKLQPVAARPATAPALGAASSASASAKAAQPANASAATPNAKLLSSQPAPKATVPASVTKESKLSLEVVAPAANPEGSRKAPASAPVLIPVKIVAQAQPALPEWAKGLDLDDVVKLDATIDEKGNLAATKVLSGARPLQRAAQDAVQLWIFEPAQLGGKPVSTHLILVVEFQR
jgi:outer membrane biosynthesis protein TonB